MIIIAVQGGFRKDEISESSNFNGEKTQKSFLHPEIVASETDDPENSSLYCCEPLTLSLPNCLHVQQCESSFEVINLEDEEWESSLPEIVITDVQGNFDSYGNDENGEYNIDEKSQDSFSDPGNVTSETDASKNHSLACLEPKASSLHDQSGEPSFEVISLDEECESSLPDIVITSVQGNFYSHGKNGNSDDSNFICEKSQDSFSYLGKVTSETDASENPSLVCLETKAPSLSNSLHDQSCCEHSFEVITLEDECESPLPEIVITAVQGNIHDHKSYIEHEKSNCNNEKYKNLSSSSTSDISKINSDEAPNLEPLISSKGNKPTQEVISYHVGKSSEFSKTSIKGNLNIQCKSGRCGNFNSNEENRREYLCDSSNENSKLPNQELKSLAQGREAFDSTEINMPVIESVFSIGRPPSPNWFDPGEDDLSTPSRGQPADETIDAEENPRYPTPVNANKKKKSSGPILGESIPCLVGSGDEDIPGDEEDDSLIFTRVVTTATDDTKSVPRRGSPLLESAENSSPKRESIARTFFSKEPVAAEAVVSPPKTASPVGRMPPQIGLAAKCSLCGSTLAASSREEAVEGTAPAKSFASGSGPRKRTSVTPSSEEVHLRKAPEARLDSTTRDLGEVKRARTSSLSEGSNSTKPKQSSHVKPWSPELSSPIEAKGATEGSSSLQCGVKRKTKSNLRKTSCMNTVTRSLKPQSNDCMPCFFPGSHLPIGESSLRLKSQKHFRTRSAEEGDSFSRMVPSKEMGTQDNARSDRNGNGGSEILWRGRKRKSIPSVELKSPIKASGGCLLPERKRGCVKTKNSSEKKRVRFAADVKDDSGSPDPTLNVRVVLIDVLKEYPSLNIGKEGFDAKSMETLIAKRKRGCPRKIGKEDESSGSMPVDCQILKKKRGRPRKNASGTTS